jgi:hypothetical protein
MKQKKTPAIPTGSDFLQVSARHQDRCAAQSSRYLARLGIEVRETYDNLGTLLSLLDRFASCFWGCHGKEHVIEYLVGRSVSCARAALRLIEFGHYDEALALVRSIAEIGNLIWLFFIKTTAIRDWLDLPEKERRSRYSPAAVRKAIEQVGSVVPHQQADYAWLCEVAVHPNPQTTPQSHNIHGVPTLGGVYQERGHIACLTQLAWAVASVGGPAAKLALLERSHAETIVEAAIRVVEGLPVSDGAPEVTGSSEQILQQTRWLGQNLRAKGGPSSS